MITDVFFYNNRVSLLLKQLFSIIKVYYYNSKDIILWEDDKKVLDFLQT